jgi:hypothetical protein
MVVGTSRGVENNFDIDINEKLRRRDLGLGRSTLGIENVQQSTPKP